MSTRQHGGQQNSTRPRRNPSTTPVDYPAMSLQERFAIFDTFAQEIARNSSYLSPPSTISPPRVLVTAGRRCVKRVPLPVPPTVLECPEEEEEDYLEEAESTTACDEWSPVYASSRDKPLPLAPCHAKALPPTPPNRNKPLPLPPSPQLGRSAQQSQISSANVMKP